MIVSKATNKQCPAPTAGSALPSVNGSHDCKCNSNIRTFMEVKELSWRHGGGSELATRTAVKLTAEMTDVYRHSPTRIEGTKKSADSTGCFQSGL